MNQGERSQNKRKGGEELVLHSRVFLPVVLLKRRAILSKGQSNQVKGDGEEKFSSQCTRGKRYRGSAGDLILFLNSTYEFLIYHGGPTVI